MLLHLPPVTQANDPCRIGRAQSLGLGDLAWRSLILEERLKASAFAEHECEDVGRDAIEIDNAQG
jgi:hypothetical protein